MKNALAVTFLIVGFLITLWTWAFLADLPWVPHPGGRGMYSGIAMAVGLGILRWVALSVAFAFLLTTGRLHGWAPFMILRILMVMVGITLIEICMFPIQMHSVDESVAPHFRLLFRCLVFLVPLAVMAGGQFGSRTSFTCAAVGALAAAVWPVPSYTPPPPDRNSIEFMLHNVEPKDDQKEVLARLEKHHGWVRQVSRSLDGGWGFDAAVLLSLKPSALSEDVQERCWNVALGNFGGVKMVPDWGEDWMPPEVSKIALIVQGLASIPGPVRDRHRADFVVIRDFVNFYRNEKPGTRHLELPDVKQADWATGGK